MNWIENNQKNNQQSFPPMREANTKKQDKSWATTQKILMDQTTNKKNYGELICKCQVLKNLTWLDEIRKRPAAEILPRLMAT